MFRISSTSSARRIAVAIEVDVLDALDARSGSAPRSRSTPAPSRRSVSLPVPAEHAPSTGAEALEERGVEQCEQVVVRAAVQHVDAAVAELACRRPGAPSSTSLPGVPATRARR